MVFSVQPMEGAPFRELGPNLAGSLGQLWCAFKGIVVRHRTTSGPCRSLPLVVCPPLAYAPPANRLHRGNARALAKWSRLRRWLIKSGSGLRLKLTSETTGRDRRWRSLSAVQKR